MAELFDSLQAGPVLRTCVQDSVAFCNRPETAGDIISGRFVGPVVFDERVKFHDPRLNCSEESQPKAIGCGIFGRFSNADNCRPEVTGDILSGVVANNDNSKLNSGRNIRIFVRQDPFCALLHSI